MSDSDAPGAAPRIAEDDRADWTTGPAKHIAAALLIGLSLIGAAIGAGTERFDPEQRYSASRAPLLININSADEARLQLLPGIGPALAERIVEDRNENGSFERLADLERVPRIGPRTLENLKPYAATSDDPDVSR